MSSKIPNPLPCGCGAKGTPDLSDEVVRYRDVHVVFCPLHAAAQTLLDAVENALGQIDTWGDIGFEAIARLRAAAKLAKK